MIVDAHVHFWDPAARHHDWLAELPPLHRRFGPEDLDAGCHPLSGAVIVQADCRDDEALDEVRWLTALAAEHPIVLGIVAYAPLHLGAGARAAVQALVAEPLVVGVRRLLQAEPPALLRSPELAEGIRLLGEARMPFDVCVTHEQLPAVAELAAACPGVSLVLDHVGKPPARTGALDPWRADLARIAQHANVVCKLSGLTTEAGPGWTEAGVRPYLDHALQAFGPGRCLVGSDWPVASLTTSVERWFDLVLSVLDGYTDAERAAVLRENARAVYGLATPAHG